MTHSNLPDVPDLPLAGLRVIEFSRVLAGPYCTALLGDLGAEVIKVEPPGGDDYRAVGRLMLPFSVRRISPNSSKYMRFSTIRLDVPVDTLRERPPAVRPDTTATR